MHHWRAILFDIGGVLVRTEDPAPRQRLAQQYGLSREGLENLVFGSPVSLAAERGEASEEDVWQFVRRSLHLNEAALVEFKRDFWAGDRLDQTLVAWLAKKRSHFRIGLLTNCWSREPLTYYSTLLGLPDHSLAGAVDAVVSSAQVGVRKPHPRIFEAILQVLGVPPGESIFVDDFLENVEGARALGMTGIHFRKREDVLSALDRMLHGGQLHE